MASWRLSPTEASAIAARIADGYQFNLSEDRWADPSRLAAPLTVRVLDQVPDGILGRANAPRTFMIQLAYVRTPTSAATISHELTHLQDFRQLQKKKLSQFWLEGRANSNAFAYRSKLGLGQNPDWKMRLARWTSDDARAVFSEAVTSKDARAQVEEIGTLWIEHLRLRFPDAHPRTARMISDLRSAAGRALLHQRRRRGGQPRRGQGVLLPRRAVRPLRRGGQPGRPGLPPAGRQPLEVTRLWHDARADLPRGRMISGVQSLETILAAARSKGEPIGELFNVPVLLLLTEDTDEEPITSVTSPAAAALPDMAGDPQTTIVVPIQARYPAPGVTQMTFGRSSVCDIVLPIASVSKHHGFFETMAGVWLVSDAGSTNGTSVGGQRVQKGGVELRDGCSVRLGRVLTQFLMPPTFCELLRQRLSLERLAEARR